MREKARPEITKWAEAQIGGEAGWSRLAGDGSDKLFWRLTFSRGTMVAVDGGLLEEDRFPENQAFLKIGRHLEAKGIPVPKIEAEKAEAGFFLIEDLGDTLLAGPARRMSEPERYRLYRRVIDLLIELQTRGAKGFRPAWCAQTGRYDREMILKYESSYFMRAFAHDYCGRREAPSGLEEELTRLAGRAASSGPVLFLHRDFQSRNIMLHQDRIRIIDYQGGRLGPPGYDLASLLVDPYVGLSPEEQEALLDYYVERAGFGEEEFRKDYKYLTLHRIMQMLGAFAFLSQVKGRPGFREHIPATLARLRSLLDDPEFENSPILKRFVNSLSLNKE